MGAVTPGETFGTLYNIRVGTNKVKQSNTQTLAAAGCEPVTGGGGIAALSVNEPSDPCANSMRIATRCSKRKRSSVDYAECSVRARTVKTNNRTK